MFGSREPALHVSVTGWLNWKVSITAGFGRFLWKVFFLDFLGIPISDVWGLDEMKFTRDVWTCLYNIKFHDFLAQPAILKLHVVKWSMLFFLESSSEVNGKLMVWGPVVWIPGILLWKGILFRSTDLNHNHQSKPPIYHWSSGRQHMHT